MQNLALNNKEVVQTQMPRSIRQKRRTFSRGFKLRCVKQVLAGEKQTKDFIGKDGRPLYYGNVQVWVNEYLAEKWGPVDKNLVKAYFAAPAPQVVTVPNLPGIGDGDWKQVALTLAAALRNQTDLEVRHADQELTQDRRRLARHSYRPAKSMKEQGL